MSSSGLLELTRGKRVSLFVAEDYPWVQVMRVWLRDTFQFEEVRAYFTADSSSRSAITSITQGNTDVVIFFVKFMAHADYETIKRSVKTSGTKLVTMPQTNRIQAGMAVATTLGVTLALTPPIS